MKDFLSKTSGRGRRRAGDSFATLLFAVGAIAFGGAVFALTELFIGQVDTTMSYVPMNATAYVHSYGRVPTEAMLSSTTELPVGLHPYEFAAFTSEGDDAPQHGTVLAWRKVLPPTKEEVAILLERGATPLDETHFFFGDASLATAAKVAAAAHASLADDAIRKSALDAARGLYPIQALATPRELASNGPSTLLRDLLPDISPEPVVAGASIRENAVVARVLPLSAATAFTNPPANTTAPRINTNRLLSDFVVTEPNPHFNIAPLFSFGPVEGTFVTHDMIAEVENVIRSVSDSPYALWAWRPTTEQAKSDFIIDFPEVAVVDMASALLRSFAVHNPATEPLTLPDGDIVNELRVQLPFSVPSEGTGDMVIGGDDARLVVGPDGHGGTLVGSSSENLNEFRNPIPLPEPMDPCGDLDRKVTINDLSLIDGEFGFIKLLSEKIGMNTVSFGQTVGNGLKVCGYKR